MRTFKINTLLIKEYMLTYRLSKAKFCKQCSICMTTLNKIINGRTDINLLSISAIAHGMGISFKELFIIYPFD